MFAEFSTSCPSFQHDIRRNKKRLWCNICAVIKTMTTWKSFLECFDDATDTTIWISSCYWLLPKFDWVFSAAIENQFFSEKYYQLLPFCDKTPFVRPDAPLHKHVVRYCKNVLYRCLFLLRYFGHWNIWVICLSCIKTHCNSVCSLKKIYFQTF